MRNDQPAHYGEEWRPWPGGCRCHGEGVGYFSDYRALFGEIFARSEQMFLGVAVEGDAGEVYRWWVGYFSWTPYGELLEIHKTGIKPTRARAEAECRQAVEAIG